jgi:hypothetical protein
MFTKSEHSLKKKIYFSPKKMQEQAQTYIKDYKPKAQKKYFRPYFSPKTGLYEMDYVIAGHKNKNERYYLAVININTRYLFFIPFELNMTPNQAATKEALEFINDILKENNQQMTNLHGDADQKSSQNLQSIK